MSRLYNSQQQSKQQTQSFNTGYNPEPMINFSTAPVVNSTDIGEQQWKHFLRNNSPSVVSKLMFIGFFYFLIGILSIGLDVGLMSNGGFSYFIGIGNGFFLFTIGILTMILCRQQVYVLTSLFVVVYFQLFVSIITLIYYGLYIYGAFHGSSHCTDLFDDCQPNTIQSILIATLAHVIITFCLVIANFIIITNARRPPITLAPSAYVVYDPHAQSMPVSFQNPCITSLNQSSSA